MREDGENQMKLGHRMTDEQRARMSLAQMGNTNNLGNHCSEETKAKIGAASRGRIKSPKTLEEMSAAAMGNKHSVGHITSPETRAKMSVAKKGKPKSSEHRKKISAAMMGKKNGLGYCQPQEARTKLSVMRKGCLNHAWKGGITPINTLVRTSMEYVAWRIAVFERDHYTCQDCGAHNGMGHAVLLEAHHIHEFAQYLDERFVVDNGKTLCLECHNKTKGRKMNVTEATT